MGFDLIVPVVGASDLDPSWGQRKTMQAGTPAVPGKDNLRCFVEKLHTE